VPLAPQGVPGATGADGAQGAQGDALPNFTSCAQTIAINLQHAGKQLTG
jgi:hypothetical protein